MRTAKRLEPIGSAARLIGVSVQTLRRWGESGKVRCWRDHAGRRYFDPDEILGALRPDADSAAAGGSDA